MSTVIDILKDTVRLSSLPTILSLFAVGIVLLYGRRTAVWGRRWLTATILGYWTLSTPAGAWIISAPVSGRNRPMATAEQAAGAQAVVMLGGGTLSHVAYGRTIDDLGSSSLRLIEAVRVYHLLGDPLVIMSGGATQKLVPGRSEAEAYRDAAIRLGIPSERIAVEDRSLTTREQALFLKPILAARGITRFVLVTSPTHMGRSLAAFRAVGLDPIGSASPLREQDRTSYWSPVPERESLVISDTAIYDCVALLYYWANGWLAP